MNEFVDLDSPTQLLDRKSNKVITQSDNPEQNKESMERPPLRPLCHMKYCKMLEVYSCPEASVEVQEM